MEFKINKQDISGSITNTMGVPRLFPWVVKAFKKAVIQTPSGKNVLNVKYLYLDANGLLHSAAQQVFNYGDKKRHLNPYTSLPYDKKIHKVYELFFTSLVLISSMVSSEILYIAIDGPAPLAKQAQQRQRRFAAAANPAFDSTVITPGTLFMFELTKYINYRIRKEINNGIWKRKRVIFSPPTVPGEGEHKIMEYIRSLGSDAISSSHCMFGPDGDLIMLTLATHLPNIYLLREDQYNLGFYDLLDMGMIRKEMPVVLGLSTENRSLDHIIDDFIFLGFLVGNDFLPKIKMFMYLEDGLNLMIATYTKMTAKGTKNLLVDKDGKLSYQNFIRFLEEMARREKDYIFDQSKIRVPDARFVDHTLLKHISNDKFDFVKYREAYYMRFGVATEGGVSLSVRKMCIDYIKTLEWVFQYYITGLKSWEYYYPWHYAPLMGDLLDVLKSMDQKEISATITFTKGEPSLPFVQLLSVMSSKNASLLPKPFHQLMTNPDSPLVKEGYYPDSFVIDYEGKTKEHMGVTILPFIDVDVVRAAYTPIASRLKNTYVRNSRGAPSMFVYDDTYLADYISDYGKLIDMRVRKIKNDI